VYIPSNYYYDESVGEYYYYDDEDDGGAGDDDEPDDNEEVDGDEVDAEDAVDNDHVVDTGAADESSVANDNASVLQINGIASRGGSGTQAPSAASSAASHPPITRSNATESRVQSMVQVFSQPAASHTHRRPPPQRSRQAQVDEVPIDATKPVQDLEPLMELLKESSFENEGDAGYVRESIRIAALVKKERIAQWRNLEANKASATGSASTSATKADQRDIRSSLRFADAAAMAKNRITQWNMHAAAQQVKFQSPSIVRAAATAAANSRATLIQTPTPTTPTPTPTPVPVAPITRAPTPPEQSTLSMTPGIPTPTSPVAVLPPPVPGVGAPAPTTSSAAPVLLESLLSSSLARSNRAASPSPASARTVTVSLPGPVPLAAFPLARSATTGSSSRGASPAPAAAAASWQMPARMPSNSSSLSSSPAASSMMSPTSPRAPPPPFASDEPPPPPPTSPMTSAARTWVSGSKLSRANNES